MNQRQIVSVMACILSCTLISRLRAEADSLVPKFAEYWKTQTGQYPARLLFDSRATTYAGLNLLNQRQVGFITIRRRGPSLLARVSQLPADRWRTNSFRRYSLTGTC